MAQRKVYYIPDNFVDDEKIFGGKFRKRNFIEAVIFTLPVLGLFWLINWATGIGWGTLFYPTFLFGIATFFLFIIGYNGDSWGETLLLAQKFRSNKFNISTYNPRVKTELTADYLANPNANSKAEAIRNFIKNLNDVLAGARGQSEIADDLTSDKTIVIALAVLVVGVIGSYNVSIKGLLQKDTQTQTVDTVLEFQREILRRDIARYPVEVMLENAKHQIVQKEEAEKEKEEAAKLAVQQEEERQRILNSTTYVWDEVSTPTYGQSYASITCDEIGLSSRLYWGDDQSMINTAQGVYEYTGTSQIGYPGCHLLAAHNSSVFSLLQYASVGDIFTVTTEYGRYAYEVDSCRSGNVTADAGTIVASDGTVLVNLGDSDDRLYMYTCYPFGYYGATNQRYVVRATLIPESETINLSTLSTDDDGYMSKESHQK